MGLRTIVARLTAGDAAWIDATVARVAEILSTRPEYADSSIDLLRSEALGWLARPPELLELLLVGSEVQSVVDYGPTADPDGESDSEGGPCRALAFPADLLDALRSIDIDRLRPRATL